MSLLILAGLVVAVLGSVVLLITTGRGDVPVNPDDHDDTVAGADKRYRTMGNPDE